MYSELTPCYVLDSWKASRRRCLPRAGDHTECRSVPRPSAQLPSPPATPTPPPACTALPCTPSGDRGNTRQNRCPAVTACRAKHLSEGVFPLLLFTRRLFAELHVPELAELRRAFAPAFLPKSVSSSHSYLIFTRHRLFYLKLNRHTHTCSGHPRTTLESRVLPGNSVSISTLPPPLHPTSDSTSCAAPCMHTPTQTATRQSYAYDMHGR
ncbi:hypothetical protein FB451DRAFT_54147 [Mycena latifolia]|nr:hypothetical protein FB451DRAFT_54147 [Mycena latifolia]